MSPSIAWAIHETLPENLVTPASVRTNNRKHRVTSQFLHLEIFQANLTLPVMPALGKLRQEEAIL